MTTSFDQDAFFARAMAKEGANVVLNGFGDAGELRGAVEHHHARHEGRGPPARITAAGGWPPSAAMRAG